MDKQQLYRLKAQHETLARIDELMEGSDHCQINESRHNLSTIRFQESSQQRQVIINFIHNKDGSFVVETPRGKLTLSDKSKNAIEAMSSTMAAVVKSVLNEELEAMKAAFGNIEIDGEVISKEEKAKIK